MREFKIHNLLLSHKLLDEIFLFCQKSERRGKEADLECQSQNPRHKQTKRLVWTSEPRTSMNLDLQSRRALGRGWFVDLPDVFRSASGRIASALTHRNFRLLWVGALTPRQTS
jgi:hypothetical protein